MVCCFLYTQKDTKIIQAFKLSCLSEQRSKQQYRNALLTSSLQITENLKEATSILALTILQLRIKQPPNDKLLQFFVFAFKNHTSITSKSKKELIDSFP